MKGERGDPGLPVRFLSHFFVALIFQLTHADDLQTMDGMDEFYRVDIILSIG